MVILEMTEIFTMGQRIKIINIKPKKVKRVKRKITITRLKQRTVKK